MDTTGLFNGTIKVDVQPVTVDTMTMVKLAVVGIVVVIVWGIVRVLSK